MKTSSVTLLVSLFYMVAGIVCVLTHNNQLGYTFIIIFNIWGLGTTIMNYLETKDKHTK